MGFLPLLERIFTTDYSAFLLLKYFVSSCATISSRFLLVSYHLLQTLVIGRLYKTRVWLWKPYTVYKFTVWNLTGSCPRIVSSFVLPYDYISCVRCIYIDMV